MQLSYMALFGETGRRTVEATVTTEHPASSYGIPVIVLPDGESLSIASWILLGYRVESATPEELDDLRRVLTPYVDIDDKAGIDGGTVCDRCGAVIDDWNAIDDSAHEWFGADLCNDCYAEVR